VKAKFEDEISLTTHAVIGMLYGQSQWDDMKANEHHLAEVLTRCALGMIASGNTASAQV
jgi:hypothetical protein